MNWHGYIKGDGTCLITPLFHNDHDVLKWWTGDGRKWVSDFGGGMTGTKIMAEMHGAKNFVLHNPPHTIMPPCLGTEEST